MYPQEERESTTGFGEGQGLYELTGLAWSGNGKIERVEITTDGGRSWTAAQLQEPRLPIALTRFRMSWRFEGREAVVASRATDETGYVQPSREQLIAVRGTNSAYITSTGRSSGACRPTGR